MTVEEQIANFLTANNDRDFCDDCLAEEVGINRHQSRNATSSLAASGAFHRNRGICSKRVHDHEKKVIRA